MLTVRKVYVENSKYKKNLKQKLIFHRLDSKYYINRLFEMGFYSVKQLITAQ